MYTSSETIEAIKRHLGNVSYYKIAKKLGTSTQNVSNWKKGKSSMSPIIRMRAGKLLNQPENVQLIYGILETNGKELTTEDKKQIEAFYRADRLSARAKSQKQIREEIKKKTIQFDPPLKTDNGVRPLSICASAISSQLFSRPRD